MMDYELVSSNRNYTTPSLQHINIVFVSGYMRLILKKSKSTIIPNDIILICVSFFEAKGKDFIYSSDFDKNGICYALGGRREIDVRAEWNYGTGESILRRNAKSSFKHNSTRNNKNGAIYIDFKSKLIAPTAYSWRHDGVACDYPLNWNFEASIDGKTWHILKKHKNDSKHGINGPFKSHTWMFAPQIALVSYRMFRFQLTGKDSPPHNSSQYPYTIHCSGFEIYGRLIHITQQHKQQYEEIIRNRDMETEAKKRKEKKSQERREKYEPFCWKLFVVFVFIFVFVPDIAALIIGIKNDCASATTSNSIIIGVNLYLVLASVIHFVAIAICIGVLWIVLELADTDNYWDDEKFYYGIPIGVCCVGIWTFSWCIVGCVVYANMDVNTKENKACGDIVIAWSVLKILETLGIPVLLYFWTVFFAMGTYDYE
eukprot:549097_1